MQFQEAIELINAATGRLELTREDHVTIVQAIELVNEAYQHAARKAEQAEQLAEQSSRDAKHWRSMFEQAPCACGAGTQSECSLGCQADAEDADSTE